MNSSTPKKLSKSNLMMVAHMRGVKVKKLPKKTNYLRY